MFELRTNGWPACEPRPPGRRGPELPRTRSLKHGTNISATVYRASPQQRTIKRCVPPKGFKSWHFGRHVAGTSCSSAEEWPSTLCRDRSVTNNWRLRIRTTDARVDALKLSEDELAFYDALEGKSGRDQGTGEPTFVKIARELVEIVRKNVMIDWTVRENAPRPSSGHRDAHSA